MDTEDVLSRHFHPGNQHILKNSFGKTDKKDLTAQDGLKTLKAGRLSVAKWFAKWGGVTLLSVFSITLFIYVSFANYFRSFKQSFWLNGKYYEMVGLTQVQDGQRTLSIPIFEEKK